ncbi:MAG: PAS domain-containing protein [Rhizomicrobium sp.]
MNETGNVCALKPASERLAAAYGVWCDLAAGRVGPRREEITPARLRSAIAATFVVDVLDGGKDFRFRFAGDRIIQFMGRRLAGKLLSEQRGTPFFDGMHGMYTHCVAAREPILAGPMPVTYPGKEFLEIEVLAMPLSDDGQAITALFGAFDTWQLGTHRV